MIKQPLHIVKIGGQLIDDPSTLNSFLEAFSQLAGLKLLVHGGGKLATKLAKDLGLEVKMVEGRRITDQETLNVAVMVYAGYVNKNIVAKLQAKSMNAIGLTGADNNTILSHRRKVKSIDYGFVGDIDLVNGGQLHKLLQNQAIPVLAPITHDGQGQLLNTNADTIASMVAQEMTAQYSVSLSFCFEFNGVLSDINNRGSIIPMLSPTDVEQMTRNGTINRGMIPKLSNGFNAVSGGVTTVRICGISNLVEGTNSTELTNQ